MSDSENVDVLFKPTETESKILIGHQIPTSDTVVWTDEKLKELTKMFLEGQ